VDAEMTQRNKMCHLYRTVSGSFTDLSYRRKEGRGTRFQEQPSFLVSTVGDVDGYCELISN
jgi:hypothetical protein